jgi:Mrp family chromosome partitioning ATPase
VTLRSTVRPIVEFGFDVVGPGEAKGSPLALLSAGHLKTALDEISPDYAIVIVDGPPIMGLADAVLIAGSVEAVLVVVAANGIDLSLLEVAVSRLSAHTLVAGVVTKFDAKSAGVKYGDMNYYNY